MNPAYVLTHMNPKNQSINDIGRGGITLYDAMHCAALCHGIERKYISTARLKWAGDESDKGWLEIQLWLRMADEAYRKKWKVPVGKELLRRLARLAIEETLKPLPARDNERNGYSTIRFKYINSDGNIISKSAYSQTWSERYEMTYNIFNAWADVAWSQIQRNQRDTDISNPT